MVNYKLVLLSTIYTVLAMILVSLEGTYNVTKFLFGNLVGTDDYGTGMSLKNKGFYLHIIVFALLLAVPMLLCKHEY